MFASLLPAVTQIVLKMINIYKFECFLNLNVLKVNTSKDYRELLQSRAGPGRPLALGQAVGDWFKHTRLSLCDYCYFWYSSRQFIMNLHTIFVFYCRTFWVYLTELPGKSWTSHTEVTGSSAFQCIRGASSWQLSALIKGTDAQHIHR
jgi:hypothetical protein